MVGRGRGTYVYEEIMDNGVLHKCRGKFPQHGIVVGNSFL